MPDWFLWNLAIVLAAGALYCFWRSHHHREASHLFRKAAVAERIGAFEAADDYARRAYKLIGKTADEIDMLLEQNRKRRSP